jgi:hypothetical protein
MTVPSGSVTVPPDPGSSEFIVRGHEVAVHA